MPISNKRILIHIAAKNSNPLLNFALIADLNEETIDAVDGTEPVDCVVLSLIIWFVTA
jgi:hypothetical protein